MSRVTVTAENTNGLGARVLSLDSDNMVPNDHGVAWVDDQNTLVMIPYSKVYEVRIHNYG